MYRVEFFRSARRTCDQLPVEVQRRLIPRIDALAENPRPPGAIALTGPVRLWRIRVGDFRIVYQIDDAARTVSIVRIGHRREVYRD